MPNTLCCYVLDPFLADLKFEVNRNEGREMWDIWVFSASFFQSCLPTPAGQLVAVLLINCELHSLHQMGRTDRIGGGGGFGKGGF